MSGKLFRMVVGTCVRFWFGGTPVYGTVRDIAPMFPWITVEWDTPLPGLHAKRVPGELEDPASPLPVEPDLSEVPF